MHAIRLRGPWELSIGGEIVGQRIVLPCTWRELIAANAEVSGCRSLTLSRRFHRPTGLQTGDRVLLSLGHRGHRLNARLNGAELPLVARPDGTLEADITSRLIEPNELAVELAPPSPAPLDGTESALEATLEMHSTS